MTSIFSRSRSLSLTAHLQYGSSSQVDIAAMTVWRDSALICFSIWRASMVASERQMSSAARLLLQLLLPLLQLPLPQYSTNRALMSKRTLVRSQGRASIFNDECPVV